MDLPGLARLARRLEGTQVPSLAMYKPRGLQRRLAIRMRASGARSLAEYAAVLDRDPTERDRLVQALSIKVTRWYRNPSAWDRLAAELERVARSGSPALSGWSAGCASGEEAWTLAVQLVEALERAGVAGWQSTLRVDATDVDPVGLARTRAATYAPAAFAEAPAALVDRWTVAAGTERRVRERLRGVVRVRLGDLGGDHVPEAGYDVITCRNVLIYFERSVQERILLQLAEALRPGGLLLLGKVETLVGPARGRFATVDGRERLFRRLD